MLYVKTPSGTMMPNDTEVMDDVADPVDDITAAADMACEATDATASIPEAPPTDIPEMAWSHEAPQPEKQAGPSILSPDELLEILLPPRPSPRLPRKLTGLLSGSLVRWGIAICAVLTTAAAATWFGLTLYHEEQSTPATAPTVNRPTPSEPPQTASPQAAAPQPPTVMEPVPPPVTVTAPPPVTVTALPPPVAGPSAPPLPNPPLPNPPPNAYETYLQLAARDGIVVTDSPEEMHNEAYWICVAANTGNPAAVNSLIEKTEQKSPLMSRAEIRIMFADVVVAYCPAYHG